MTERATARRILSMRLLGLPRNPLPEPDLANAERQEIVLQGGMMGGGKLTGIGGMMGMVMPGMNGGGAAWAINGMSMTGDGQPAWRPVHAEARRELSCSPSATKPRGGTRCISTASACRCCRRNGAPVPHRQWQDTVLLAPKDTVECAFVADNPGDWMLHCHVIDHQMAGLMTVFRVK